MEYLYKKAPRSIASIKKEYLDSLEERTINLYNEEQKQEKSIYDIMQEKADIARLQRECANTFKESTQKTLLSNVLYYGLLENVMDEKLFNSHQKSIVANMIRNFVEEKNNYELLDQFRYQSIYLAEMANLVEACTDKVCKKAQEKIKEGLPEQDAYEIEDKDVNDFVLDVKDVIPKDITNTIVDRVQNAIDDFIETNRKNKFELKKIYDSSRDKINALKDAEANPDFSSPARPSTEDYQQMQQEAVGIAKAKEREILESSTNVFGAMVKIIMESVHRDSVLKEAYTNSYNNLDFNKVMNDVSAIYTFFEAFSTMNIIDANGKFIINSLNEMNDKDDLKDTTPSNQLNSNNNTNDKTSTSNIRNTQSKPTTNAGENTVKTTNSQPNI